MRWDLVVVGSLLVAAGPAAADWEYTHWGMTPEEVAAASGGAVTALPEDKRENIEAAGMTNAAEGTFTSGDLTLRVGFSFDNEDGGLVCVAYGPTAVADNPKLEAYLRQRYGTPANESSLDAIGMTSLSWTAPDDISLDMLKDQPGTVIHCRTEPEGGNEEGSAPPPSPSD